jgi:hypothetical protein
MASILPEMLLQIFHAIAIAQKSLMRNGLEISLNGNQFGFVPEMPTVQPLLSSRPNSHRQSVLSVREF